MRGQMHGVERQLIYDTIRELKPEIAVESGTWYGGGSTLYAARALAANGTGILHTYEVRQDRYESAKASYAVEEPELVPYVVFHLGDFHKGFAALDADVIDYATLDGPERAGYSLTSLQMVEARMRPGGVVIFHDWKTEKSRLVRPYIEDSERWELNTVLDTETGMARAVRIEPTTSSA